MPAPSYALARTSWDMLGRAGTCWDMLGRAGLSSPPLPRSYPQKGAFIVYVQKTIVSRSPLIASRFLLQSVAEMP